MINKSNKWWLGYETFSFTVFVKYTRQDVNLFYKMAKIKYLFCRILQIRQIWQNVL